MRRGVVIAAFCFAIAAFAQRFGFQREREGPRPSFPETGEFHFVRLEYTDLPQYHRGFGYRSRSGMGDGWWLVDCADSDAREKMGVERLSRIGIGAAPDFRLAD